MTRLTGHFDGKVIVPDEPVDLPRDQKLIIQVEPATAAPDEPEFGTAEYVARNMTDPLPDEDAEEMRRAIEEACERINPSRDVKLD